MALMQEIDFSVIIVNYNTAELVSRCISSVLQQKNVSVEIVVIDNASTDDSVSTIQNLLSENGSISLIRNTENMGFGRANNLAVKNAKGKYLYLLNPDGMMQDEQNLAKSLDFMQSHPEFGLVGTAIYEPRKNRFVQPKKGYPAQKMLRLTKDLEKLPGEIAWVLGASMIIPRVVYQEVGGFDPDFFLYGEEVDLCLRIRKLGYLLGYNENVVIEHFAGASESRAKPIETFLRKHRGFYLFCKKHYHLEDVKRIAKKNIFRAKIRLFFLKLIFSKKIQKELAGLYAAEELIDSL